MMYQDDEIVGIYSKRLTSVRGFSCKDHPDRYKKRNAWFPNDR